MVDIFGRHFSGDIVIYGVYRTRAEDVNYLLSLSK